MPDRLVRFTEQFFDRLSELLPEERSAAGDPSVTDFLLLELPPLRDALARDFEGVTSATDDPEVRALVSAGVLFPVVVIFSALDGTGSVEAFWVTLDRDALSY